jgi:hypothetical protein
MTPEREKHLHELKHLFIEKADSKYRRGAEEHQETLLKKDDLLEEALDEAIDLFIYLATELQRRKRVIVIREEPSAHTED